MRLLLSQQQENEPVVDLHSQWRLSTESGFRLVSFKTSWNCDDKHCDRRWWESHAQTSPMAIIISWTHAAPNKEVSNLESNHHRWWVSQNTHNMPAVMIRPILRGLKDKESCEQHVIGYPWYKHGVCTGQFSPKIMRFETRGKGTSFGQKPN